jgi:hypothetical protein
VSSFKLEKNGYTSRKECEQTGVFKGGDGKND